MNIIIRLYKKIDEIYSNHYYFLYTVIFIILVFLVFGYFFVNGKSLVWGTDNWNQHFKAALYYSKLMRVVAKDLLSTGVLNIPTYSFSIGYGSDIITTLHYYAIIDPLLLPAILIPTKYMVYFYCAVVILRLYLSGITFSMFCFYTGKKPASPGSFCKTAVMAGAFVYVFCGYTLFAALAHPFFMNPMIYFPLVLLGVEKILDKRSPVLFIVAVFVSAISNLYFFYMIVILTALYVLWRLLAIYSKKQICEILYTLGKITIFAILGTGMGAAILVPVILAALHSSRLESKYVYNFFYRASDYASHVGGFLSASGMHDWTFLGYAAIALIAIILLFMQKEHKEMKIAFIILTLMTLLPPLGRAMNGFSYVANRWAWGYSFLIAYILVLKWGNLFELTSKEKSILLACLSLYLCLCIILKESCTVSVLFGVAMAFLAFSILSLSIDLHGMKGAQGLLMICIILNIAGNAFFRYSPTHSNDLKEFVRYNEVFSKLENTEAAALKFTAKDADGFFRYSGTSITPNGTLLSGLHSTQYYWSLENGNIIRFRSENGLSDQNLVHQYANLDSRTILSALANIKYYVQPSNVPFGFVPVNLGNKYPKYQLWENKDFIPFGYTYANYISEDDYEIMSPIEKQEALLQGCVVRDRRGEEAKVMFSGCQVDYKMIPEGDISVKNNIITVNKNNAAIILTFDGMTNTETYLYITGLNFLGNQPEDSQQKWLSIYREDISSFYRKYYKGPAEVKLSLMAKNTAGVGTAKNIPYHTPKSRYYSNRENFMVNFSYDKNAKKSIMIKFPFAGKYIFDSIQVLCQPMNNYSEQVKKLAEDVLQNVDFHNKNAAFATSKVTGDITLNTAKYLLLTIPYSDGWTAVVDGKGQELLKANTMWMALYLDPGHHDILLKYQTPGLKAGAIISCVSLLIFFIGLCMGKRRSQRGDLL